MSISSGKPPVAVIILNWNGIDLLRRFLPSVVADTPPQLAHIIVADNGSTDGSADMLAREFPSVELLRFDTNHGFAEGYNRALQLTGYRYTVLLNSDVATTPSWLEPLYSYLETHPDVAAVQPKLRAVADPASFEYAGACGGFLDRHGYPYCRGRIFSTVERDRGQYDTPVTVDWATGAALMVRTALYLEAGGLDPRFFAHMEEIDLCWRLRLMGHRLAAVPASVVHHLGGGSLPASSPRKTYLNFRNSLVMLHKNLPEADRRHILLRRRLLDTLAWMQFIATGRWRHAAAILRAHRDFRSMRRHYPAAPSASRNLLGHINILTAYYLRHRHTFSELDV